MPAVAFSCFKCKTEIAVAPGVSEIDSKCPQCATPIEGFFFPAYFRAADAGPAAAALVEDTEASCFYHPQKRAARVCDGCGRLMCGLCAIEMDGEYLCPTCLDAGRKKGKLTNLENTRRRYDRMALTIAVVSVPLFGFSIFLAPAALYIAIRYWNSPGSLLGSSKIWFIAAIVIAGGILLLWLFVFGSVFFAAISAPRR